MARFHGGYRPRDVPRSPAELPAWMTQEFQNIAAALVGSFPTLWLAPQAVEPAKPREGVMANANGTSWDPGSGAGLYIYRSGAWVFIG